MSRVLLFGFLGCLLVSVALASATQCHPDCRWQCDDPVCPAVCHPICERPKCEMSCQETPCAKCTIHCERPVCEVRCPKDMCEKNDCPKCETVCQPARCHTTCEAPQPACQPVCEEPKCEWKCRKPTMCPKPKCELQCERPACEHGENQCCSCTQTHFASNGMQQAGQPNGNSPVLAEVLSHMMFKKQLGHDQCCPCAQPGQTSFLEIANSIFDETKKQQEHAAAPASEDGTHLPLILTLFDHIRDKLVHGLSKFLRQDGQHHLHHHDSHPGSPNQLQFVPVSRTAASAPPPSLPQQLFEGIEGQLEPFPLLPVDSFDADDDADGSSSTSALDPFAWKYDNSTGRYTIQVDLPDSPDNLDLKIDIDEPMVVVSGSAKQHNSTVEGVPQLSAFEERFLLPARAINVAASALEKSFAGRTLKLSLAAPAPLPREAGTAVSRASGNKFRFSEAPHPPAPVLPDDVAASSAQPLQVIFQRQMARDSAQQSGQHQVSTTPMRMIPESLPYTTPVAQSDSDDVDSDNDGQDAPADQGMPSMMPMPMPMMMMMSPPPMPIQSDVLPLSILRSSPMESTMDMPRHPRAIIIETERPVRLFSNQLSSMLRDILSSQAAPSPQDFLDMLHSSVMGLLSHHHPSNLPESPFRPDPVPLQPPTRGADSPWKKINGTQCQTATIDVPQGIQTKEISVSVQQDIVLVQGQHTLKEATQEDTASLQTADADTDIDHTETDHSRPGKHLIAEIEGFERILPVPAPHATAQKFHVEMSSPTTAVLKYCPAV